MNAIILKAMLNKTDFDKSNPFLDQASTCKKRFDEVLEKAGFPRSMGPKCEHPHAAVDFNLVHRLALFLEDPDTEIAAECSKGVRVGYKVDMPRCPWLFPEKVNWKLDPQDASFESEVNENYPSLWS